MGMMLSMATRTPFKILLSPSERAALESKAASANLPLGTWMRTVCLQVDKVSNKHALNLLDSLVSSLHDSLEGSKPQAESIGERITHAKKRIASSMAPLAGKK